MSLILNDMLVAAGLFCLLFASLEVGYRTGRRDLNDPDPRASSQVGAIQGAVLGLLGLLLAFSFAAAGTRFLLSYEAASGCSFRERLPAYRSYTFLKLAATEAKRRRPGWDGQPPKPRANAARLERYRFKPTTTRRKGNHIGLPLQNNALI